MGDSTWKRAVVAALRLLIAVAAAAPVVCQSESEPYFSLSSSRTFGSHERAEIMLSGWNVPAVQIRIYRVKDPVEFVRRMEDPHTFGGRMRRRGAKPTLLEQIHNWKRGLRRDIRLNLRGQFTESPSAHLPGSKPATKKAAGEATRFADVPVLNSEQLILSFSQPLTTKNRWNTQRVPVDVKEKGLFLVEAVSGHLSAYTVLLVSDTVLITKTGGEHLLGYLVNRETGEPVANAPIAAIAGNKAPQTFQTDTNGLSDLKMAADAQNDVKLLARHDGDVALSTIASWSFRARDRNVTGVVYTDRPVYRPGDTTHFRGILRLRNAVGYSIPTQQNTSVQVTDPDGKPVFQKDLSLNSNGVLHDEITLSRTAALGNYYIEVKSGESSVSGSFEVQEYKKPEYEVRVTPAKPRVLQGETVATTIDSRYYFGEPVNNGKVRYSIYRARYWNPLFYSDPDDEQTDQESGDTEAEFGAGDEIGNGEGRLDSEGKLAIEVPTTLSQTRGDDRYRIEARVTDQAGREIAGTGWIVATYGSFALNIQPSRYFFTPNMKAGFQVQARDYDNKPVSVAVRVTLEQWRWDSRERGQAMVSATGATDSDGKGAISLTIPTTGNSYRATVAARTPEGRMVEAAAYVWVASNDSGFSSLAERPTIQIVPDKKTYRAGEVAHILILAGRTNTPVLVAVEGRDLRSAQVIRSTSATALFDYKVTKDDEPGIFVSAHFLLQGKLHAGSKRIKVPPTDHQLNLAITTDKATYLPGQSAQYQVAATTETGAPLAHADLSLGVVDEAIYAIRRDTTPELLQFFYGREYNTVYTESSLNYYFSGEAGTRRMQLARLRPESTLAQLKPDRLVQPKVRKFFPDTAFWAADLTTDGNGIARASVPFPDSLTTWRATVRASAQDRFGGATIKTIVRKNLILRLAVPRFFVQGDEVVISGIVHNYLASAKHAKVGVKLGGLDLEGSNASSEVDVPSRGEAKVDWRVKAQVPFRHAKVTAEALTGEESDALEVELPINPPGVPVTQAKGGAIANAGSANFSFSYPADAVSGSRSVSIRLAPSIAGSLFSALDYLTSFPYGCVEQTMSSFLPNLMVTQAVKELNLKAPGDPAVLEQKTQAGLERLYAFQHPDGGWGWWQTDETHPFMTTYVIAGLAQARHLGIVIDENRLRSAEAWVEKQLTNDRSLAPDLRAYMVYALELAGKPAKAAEEASYQSRNQLSPYGQALLGLAFEEAKDSRAKSLADRLAETAQQNSLEAWWPAQRDEMLDFDADISPESTAYVTKLLSHNRPGDPLLPKAALWLVNHRSEGYWWASSKQTAMVIYGLLEYVKAGKELQPDLTVAVKVNGNPAGTQSFSGASLTEAQEIVLDESKLQAGSNRVEVSTRGTGRLYWSVSAVHYSDAARFEKQGVVSLNVLRDYFRLVPAREGDHVVYDLAPLDGAVAQGDNVAVRLTVTGSDWRYLLVEDPIPAGAEFIEREGLYNLRNKPPWWRYWFTRRELHDDRMAIFQTFFNEGQQQYFYLLKVVHPGLFHASPARVQPMYQPGIQATTEARTLEAK